MPADASQTALSLEPSMLDAVLRAEAEAATRLAAAAAEGAALLDRARASADEVMRNALERQGGLLAAIDAEQAAELRLIDERIVKTAATVVARYENVSERAVGEMAAAVLVSIIENETSGNDAARMLTEATS